MENSLSLAPAALSGTETNSTEVSLKLFRTLLDHSSDGIEVLDPETGRFLDINATTCQRLGYTREELLSMNVMEIDVALINPTTLIERIEAIRQSGSKKFEGIHKRKDGSTFPVEVNIRYVKLERDYLIASVRDITERKRAEKAIRRSRDEFKDLFDNAPVGFHEIDADGHIIRINNTELKMLGYSARELLGQFVWKISGDEEFLRRATFAKLGGEPPQENFEWIFRRKDGSTFVVMLQETILKRADGTIAGIRSAIRDISQCKQAEQALQEERAMFRNLADTIPDKIYFKDRQSRFIRANKALVQQFGLLNAADVVGKTDYNFHGKEHARQACEDEQEIMRTGQPIISKEECEKWRDGHITWASSTKLPMRDNAGNIIGIMGISRDITAHKQAEDELLWKTALLEAQVDSTLDGILVVDKQNKKILQNQRFIELFQVPKHIAEDSDDTHMLRHVIGQMKNQEQFLKKVEHLYTHPDEIGRDEVELADGKIFDRYSSPIRDKAGNSYGRIWTFRDITERKRAEESQARLATAVEQSNETIIITDKHGVILYVNPAFEKNTGYTRAEVLGQNPRILNSGKQDASFYRQMWEVLDRGEVWQGHFINKHKNGKFYEEDATISPMRDATGQIVNYVAVKRNVTREIQLESQFRQAQKMEAIGHLAGGVAHDFNNILAVIQMQADLLKVTDGITPEQRHFATEIGAATQRAAALTRQLLLFSRKQTMQLQDLDLNDSINRMTNMLRRTLGENIELQFKFAMQTLLIHADAGMLDQVLMNLAVNSRDAMPEGGQLVIETSAVSFDETTHSHLSQIRPGQFICLSVSDTGCGIPTENLQKIFEPFFTTKEVGKGTGLGLATVFGIVQQHKGWINVYSEVSRGTTFRIYLPRLEKISGQKNEQSTLPAMRGGKETILVVEDDSFLRASVRTTLTQLGYRVLEATNGVEALDVWKQHCDEIQLLLTDLVMPGGIHGMELAGQLLDSEPKLKVIYASGYSAEVASKDFPLEEGVNFLNKPFEAHKLAQTVRQRLDAKA